MNSFWVKETDKPSSKTCQDTGSRFTLASKKFLPLGSRKIYSTLNEYV